MGTTSAIMSRWRRSRRRCRRRREPKREAPLQPYGDRALIRAVSEKGEATRDRLLAVADELIYRRGYAGASFEEIVAASGLRRGHINYYFRTKEDLLASVIERRLAEVETRLASWDAAVTDPAERLRRFTEMVLGRESDLIESGCPIGTLSSELG